MAAQETAMNPEPLRLGINIDHVATIRNARGGSHPDPVRAAHLAILAGADGITVHLREDRRHIRDRDVERLKSELFAPINLEMAATDEMVAIALRIRPNAACIVPERREERTTEGGLKLLGVEPRLRRMVGELADAGIRVSLFVEADRKTLDAAVEVGAAAVELHTGEYCHAVLDDNGARADAELARLQEAAAHASGLGLEVHGGHGLDFTSVGPVAAIPQIVELNIGHFLIGEAVFVGLDEAIGRMRSLMDQARAGQPA
jgi:pyridoxine 5-phosphate synthase